MNRSRKAVLLCVFVSLGLAGSGAALARGGHGGHGGHHGGHHGGARIGAVIGGAIVGAAIYRAYAPSYYYAPYYAPVYAAPYVPPVYVDHYAPLIAAQPQQSWWYYCAQSGAYYPYVQQCAGTWQRVPAQPPRG